ncbi:hypothetical protein OG884_06000 [Streptosporangium sp. NBC_01755]|uniref:hypothetical protein n=1 Tax=Streptosporangium sp. NBC_01755 TaxID=2975949 RepID=UPI002DD82442|nr:hypothetical protein [Streptosporangium sp. NBC_01755]WSD01479.1 hypothetical protein OG884_06000 [Streptosporangium sp. NBC_01755]
MSNHETTTTHIGHNGAQLRIAANADCEQTNNGCATLTINDGDAYHASARYTRSLAERICQAAGLGAVLLEAADHPGYEALTDLTLEEKEQLPGRFHIPRWDGDGEPNAWLCAVCWDEGTATGWPCEAAMKNGGDVFTSTGEFYTPA